MDAPFGFREPRSRLGLTGKLSRQKIALDSCEVNAINGVQGARPGNHGGVLQSGSKVGVSRPGVGGRPPSEVRAAWRALGWRCIEELSKRKLEDASISDLLRMAEFAKKYGGDPELSAVFPEQVTTELDIRAYFDVSDAKPVAPLSADQFYEVFTHLAAGTFHTSDWADSTVQIDEAKAEAQRYVDMAKSLPKSQQIRTEFAQQLYAALKRNAE